MNEVDIDQDLESMRHVMSAAMRRVMAWFIIGALVGVLLALSVGIANASPLCAR